MISVKNLAHPFDSKISYDENQIGEIIEIFPSGGFVVKCQTKSLMVTEYEWKISIRKIFSN